ncbi:MAG TPA: hypothetical protein VKZ53_19740 [Candidatus Angelobacter sp.]|nr:hypothetical protein [Candidatus Angelobacter sp.]
MKSFCGFRLFLFAIVLTVVPAWAQFPKIPKPSVPSVPSVPSTVSTPKVPSETDRVIKGAIASALERTLKEEAPIQYDAVPYPSLGQLPGTPFSATGDSSIVLRQMAKSTDGTVQLPQGDYRIPVSTYSMRMSGASPNADVFALAPLRGKRADMIWALNARSVDAPLTQPQVQAASWAVQSGMKYDEMPHDIQTVIDRLIPEFKPRLATSYYEQIKATWDGFSTKVSGLPLLDDALDRLGDVGKTIRKIHQNSDEIKADAQNFQAMAHLFAPPGPKAPAGGATQWSVTAPGVYQRLLNPSSYDGPGSLEIRVTAKGAVAVTSLIASPFSQAQPLSMAPMKLKK